MTPRKKRRMYLVVAVLAGVGAATALVLNAFEQNILFFQSPSDISSEMPAAEQRFRLGGLVEYDTVERSSDGLNVNFRVTDTAYAVPVTYRGILPDLFREGQGVVADGAFNEDGVFVATEVLARHDETYMAPEVAEALDRLEAEADFSDTAETVVE